MPGPVAPEYAQEFNKERKREETRLHWGVREKCENKSCVSKTKILFNLRRSNRMIKALVVQECLLSQFGLDLVQSTVNSPAELHPALTLDPLSRLLSIPATLDLQRDLKEAQQHLAVGRLAELVRLVELLRNGERNLGARMKTLEEDNDLVSVPSLNVFPREVSPLEGSVSFDHLDPSTGEREGLLCQCGVVLHFDRQLETFAMEPRVPIDLVKRIGGVGIALEELEEVLAPLLRGDGSAVEGVEVALGVRKEVVETADGAFEVKKEVGALLVRDGAEGIVRVLTVLESGNETLEAWSVCKLLESILERLGANDV